MLKRFALGSFILLSIPTYAQVFSTDTALLFELVTTTASQLNELEKLLSNAERYTKRMQEYNELAQDEYFRAERVLYIAESVAAKKSLQNLGDLNSAIRELKYSLGDLRELMKEYAIIKENEDDTKKIVKVNKELNEKKSRVATNQVEKSARARTASRASQLTAQNTALIYEQNVEMHNTQLDLLQNSSTTNRLLAEQMEEKRVEQIEKEESYALGVRR